MAIPPMATIAASALLGNLVAAYPVPCTWLATEWWTVEASTCSVSLPGFLTARLLELSHNNPATCQAAPSRACGDCKCCCFLTMSCGIRLVEHWVAWVFLEQLGVSYKQLAHLSMDFSATLGSAPPTPLTTCLPTWTPAACGAWETWNSFT